MRFETHQEALKRLQLKVGDKVKILTKADDYEDGWESIWVNGKMDSAIGKTGIVKEIGKENEGIQVLIEGITDSLGNSYFYPAFVLDKIVIDVTAGIPQSPPNMTVMDEAKSLIYGDREKDYGKTSDNFRDIAKGWEVITKTTITPEQVGLMMAWLKICRANKDNCKKRDSLVDLAGYAGCIEKIKNNL